MVYARSIGIKGLSEMQVKAHQNRKGELLTKFVSGSLTHDDARKLRNMLKQERRQAAELGDMVAVIAIGFLIAAVIVQMAGPPKK